MDGPLQPANSTRGDRHEPAHAPATCGPTVVIGAVLFGACIASVWSINRLQGNLAQILSENVTSLEAAQELEIQLRQLRFHSFLHVIDPTDERRELVGNDHAGFERAMETVRQ